MILCKLVNARMGYYRRYFLNNVNRTSVLLNLHSVSGYSCLQNYIKDGRNQNFKTCVVYKYCFTSILTECKRYWSKGILDGIFNESHERSDEFDTSTTTKIFPSPRVTLQNLSAVVPEKMFDLHYKQSAVTPKGGRKKAAQVNHWTCIYAFEWPEKMKFEGTAISKKQAAEKAATQAVHWLYTINKINKDGRPIYNKEQLDELRGTLNEHLTVSLSENSAERIARIWNDYENEIKEIYTKTHNEALKKTLAAPVALAKDSTIDEHDDYSEAICENGSEEENLDLKNQIHPVYGRHIQQPTSQDLRRRESALKRSFQRFHEEAVPLPIDEYASTITSTLEQNRVVVIIGAAGCGKSTRTPSAILENGGVNVRAIVSEPRRVAAISLSQMVADELGEEVGESVGYQVRLRSKPPRPPGGSILFCTSGVLLRRLQSNPGLEGCTHVIIDEAHERDVNTDISLLLLKRALKINPELKVVIMSATIDAEVFTKYFDNCPIVEVPGRAFPVEVTYLEDLHKKLGPIDVANTLEASERDGKPYIYCDEVINVIKAADRIEPEGAILVFLPGWGEISAVARKLNEEFSKSGTHFILPVHSKLSTEEQSKIFSKALPGVRKIILSTNIAETSITIRDVVCVIDSGAHKENRIQEGTDASTLETVWISKAAANQRSGRAGRVRDGTCYRLYTKDRGEKLQCYQLPEVLRVPLEQTVLDCKTYAPDDKVADFLSELPEPPTHRAIDAAIHDLMDLGALTPSERLTPLGIYMTAFPLPPRLSRGLINSSAIGATLSVANITTHVAERKPLCRDSVINNTDIRELKSKYSTSSDHMALHRIQEAFEQVLDKKGRHGVEKWCDNNRLIPERLNYVKALSTIYLEQLLKCGLIEPNPDIAQLNRYSDIEPVCMAALLSGCDSIIVTKRQIRKKGKLATVKNAYTSTGEKAHVSTESVNHGVCKRSTTKPDILVHTGGYRSMERRALLVNNTSRISVLTALLFCQGHLKIHGLQNDPETSILLLPRHSLRVQVPTSHAELIVKAKEMIWNTFQYYYEKNIKTNYDSDTTATRYRIRLFKAVAKILIEAETEFSDNIYSADDLNDDLR